MHLVFATKDLTRNNGVVLSFNGNNVGVDTRFMTYAPLNDGKWYWEAGNNSTNRVISTANVSAVNTRAVMSAYKSSSDGNNGMRINSGTRFLSSANTAASAGTTQLHAESTTPNNHIYGLVVFNAKLSTADEIIAETKI